MTIMEELEKLKQNYLEHRRSSDSKCSHEADCTFAWMEEAYVRGQRQASAEIKKRCAEEIQRWVDKSTELTFEQKSVLLIAKQTILNMRIE